MAGGFTDGFKQSFTATASISVTHNLAREDIYVRVVIGGVTRNDLVVSVVPASGDPTNQFTVTLASSQTGIVQVLLADTIPVSLPTLAQNAAPPGTLVQSVDTNTAAVVTATGTIPQDDSIPQNTEGTTILSLAITPTSTANKLHVRFSCSGEVDGNQSFVAALFQDVDGTVADAIAVIHQGARNQADLNPQDLALEHVFTPATTGVYTFEIRIGIPTGNFYVNGDSGGGRLFGGVSLAQLIIEERS